MVLRYDAAGLEPSDELKGFVEEAFDLATLATQLADDYGRAEVELLRGAA